MEIPRDDIIFQGLAEFLRGNLQSELLDLDISQVGEEIRIRASLKPTGEVK